MRRVRAVRESLQSTQGALPQCAGGATNAIGVSIFVTFPMDGICIIDICFDRIISDMTEYSNFHPPCLQ